VTAEEYVAELLKVGSLKPKQIAQFVRYFQAVEGLVNDGKPGPKTLERLAAVYPDEPAKPGRFLSLPLRTMAGRYGSRKPQVTSGFRPADRKNHDGLDFFYRWEVGDEPKFVGDGGCEGKNADGSPKWVVPYGAYALAAADGVVQIAGPSATGYRVWVNHGNGLRTGYFHLANICSSGAGQPVQAGTALGQVGHNPYDSDGRHLHFELSPVEKYEPMDPTPYFKEGLL
jgi:murein DD-endopeptidase MepM/ murein hydrolase activator NlpD